MKDIPEVDPSVYIKYTLKILVPAIEEIDGGCSHCISRFIELANEDLELVGIPYRYGLSGEWNTDVEVIDARE